MQSKYELFQRKHEKQLKVMPDVYKARGALISINIKLSLIIHSKNVH